MFHTHAMLHAWHGMHMKVIGQRTEVHSSPSTVWILGLKRKLSALATRASDRRNTTLAQFWKN